MPAEENDTRFWTFVFFVRFARKQSEIGQTSREEFEGAKGPIGIARRWVSTSLRGGPPNASASRRGAFSPALWFHFMPRLPCRTLRFALAFLAVGSIAAAEAPPGPPPHINRNARAKVLRAEAAKYADQIKPLDEILKPLDAKAAELRWQGSLWDNQAATYRAEADQLELSGHDLQDPASKIQTAANNFRGTASTLRTLRQAVAAGAGGDSGSVLDQVVGATGVDLPSLARTLEDSAQALNGATAEKLQTEIDRLDQGVVVPLQRAHDRVETARAGYEQRFRALDPDIAKKNDEIAGWQTERKKHEANMEEAERRCAASAKVVLGVSICTDLTSKAWFFQAQAGVGQADTAIGLAQLDIALTEGRRLNDRVGLMLSTAEEQWFDSRIAEVERQIQPLRDARATLLARREKTANAPVAKQKRALAATATAQSAALRTELAHVYQPLADKAKERDQLIMRRGALLQQAADLEARKKFG